MRKMTETRRVQDWVTLLLAGCLFVSPWVLGFAAERYAAWNAWASAVVIAVLAIIALTAFAEWEEWVNAVVGAWVFVAPWALGFAANVAAFWTHVVLGLLVAAVSAWAVWQDRQRGHATA